MTIKIIKCSDEFLWYSKFIGHSFVVYSQNEEHGYIVRRDNETENKTIFWHIEKQDAIVTL